MIESVAVYKSIDWSNIYKWCFQIVQEMQIVLQFKFILGKVILQFKP